MERDAYLFLILSFPPLLMASPAPCPSTLAGLNLSSLFTSLYNLYNVLKTVRAKAAQQNVNPVSVSGSVGRHTFLVAISRTAPLVIMLVLALCWLEYSPTDIMQRHHRLYVVCDTSFSGYMVRDGVLMSASNLCSRLTIASCAQWLVCANRRML